MQTADLLESVGPHILCTNAPQRKRFSIIVGTVGVTIQLLALVLEMSVPTIIPTLQEVSVGTIAGTDISKTTAKFWELNY